MTAKYDYSTIPPELKALNQWVLWKREQHSGKVDKIPYQMSGHTAQSNNSRTWTTFSAALQAYQNSSEFSGLGFVLNESDNIVVLDFDKCTPFNAALETLLAQLASFTEVSQSKSGLHAFIIGKKPDTRCKFYPDKYPFVKELGCECIEVYEKGRFFALTGEVYKDFRDLKNCQLQLDGVFAKLTVIEKKTPVKQAAPAVSLSLDDTQVLEKMQTARNSADIQALLQGNVPGVSHSEADLALCSHLAFYTQDVSQIDRLFRASGLYREKWSRKTGDSTYGMMTIRKALAGLRDTYKPGNGNGNGRPPHPAASSPAESPAPGNRTVSDEVRRATIGVLTRKRKEVFENSEALNSFLRDCKGEGCQYEDVKRLCNEKQWQAITPVNHGSFGDFVKRAKQIDSQLYSTLKKQGEQAGDVGNAELMARFLRAHHDFHWNDLEMCPYIDGVQMTDDMESELYVECHNAGHKGKALMKDVLITECKKTRVHPIKQYFESLKYDKKPHIKQFTDHVNDSKGLSYPLFRKWMIQAVKKVYEASQNEVLVLVGGQNVGKSYLVEWLCPPALKEYYVECGVIDPTNKDHQIQATSNFFGELGELGSTTKRKEVRALKDFLTKKFVKTRLPYGKRDVKKAVTMSYIGTENEDGTGFLNDTTGNRRYTVLDIIDIDWKYTKHCDVDQMWAEAYTAYVNAEKTDLRPEDKALMQGLIDAHTTQTVEREYLLSSFEFTMAKDDKMLALAIFNHMSGLGYKVPQENAFYRIARELKSMGIPGEKGRNGKIYFGIRPLRSLQKV